jgi:hypothetical protein
MSRLADDMDVKIDQQLHDINSHALLMEDKVGGLFPMVEKLQHELRNAEGVLTHHLLQGITVRISTDILITRTKY